MTDPFTKALAHVDAAARAVHSAQCILEGLEEKRSVYAATDGQIEWQRHVCQWTRQNAAKAGANLIAIRNSRSRLASARTKMDEAWGGPGVVPGVAMTELFEAQRSNTGQEATSNAFAEDPLPAMPGTDPEKTPWSLHLPNPQRPQTVSEDLAFATGVAKSLASTLAQVTLKLSAQEVEVTKVENMINEVLDVEVANENGPMVEMLRNQLLGAHGAAQHTRTHIAALKSVLEQAQRRKATAQAAADAEKKRATDEAKRKAEAAKKKQAEEKLVDDEDALNSRLADDHSSMTEMLNNLRCQEESRERQGQEDEQEAERASEARRQKIADRLNRLETERHRREQVHAARDAEQSMRQEQAARDAEHAKREKREQAAREAEQVKLQAEQAEQAAREAHLAEEQARISEVLAKLREQQEQAAREAEQVKLQAEQAEQATSEAHLAEEQARINEVLAKLRERQEERLRREAEQEEIRRQFEQEKRRKNAEKERQKRRKNKSTASQFPRYGFYPDVPNFAPPPQREQTVPEWRAATELLFANYSTMHTFPQPPVGRCNNAACLSVSRNLRACSHSIEQAFWRVPNLDVKKERLRWHPDRFSSCPEQHREVFQKMAQEVFVVLEEMYERRRDV